MSSWGREHFGMESWVRKWCRSWPMVKEQKQYDWSDWNDPWSFSRQWFSFHLRKHGWSQEYFHNMYHFKLKICTEFTIFFLNIVQWLLTSFCLFKKNHNHFYEGKKYPIGRSQSIASWMLWIRKGYAQHLQQLAKMKWQIRNDHQKSPFNPSDPLCKGIVFGIQCHWVT